MVRSLTSNNTDLKNDGSCWSRLVRSTFQDHRQLRWYSHSACANCCLETYTGALYLESTMSAVSIPRSSQPWRCPLCHCFAAPGPKGILRHMGTIHALDSNFHVICGLQGCPRSYNNYHSYKKHMYKKHRDVLELDQSLSSQLVDSNPPLEYDNFDCFDDDMSNPPPVTSVKDEKKTSALFLLKTTAVSKVSKSALDDLVSDFSLFLNDKLRTLEDDVTTYLRHKNVEVDSDLLKMFQSPSLTSPFQGLESEFLRKKYYTDHLGMLVSICTYACTCTCLMLPISIISACILLRTFRNFHRFRRSLGW